MGDGEFFSSLNLNYPGLDSVKTALMSEDTTLAKVRLLEYYQNRTSVEYFSLSSGGSTGDADKNLDNNFEVVNIWKKAEDPDGSVDWTMYHSGSTEWHYQFHRMYWLRNLGKVYGSTKLEKYATGWVSHLNDWAKDNSPGYPRTLDTGIRLRNWVESYQYFIHKYKSPSVNPDENVTILKSLIEQSRFLRDNWRDEGNWGADESRGLSAVVIMFPEFKFTPDGTWEWWRDLVLSRLEHHLTIDFFPDGVLYETSPLYHSIEYRNLFVAFTLIELNGIHVSDALLNKFIKPLEFMMHIHKPNKYLPQLSDTDNGSYLSRLRDGALLFNRQDMLYAATRGSDGTPPKETFAPFPYGGYFVMRSDWGQNQSNYDHTRYLVFDTGSNDPWHAHYDILNFEAYAYGKTIIKDPGRFGYVDRRLAYYKKTIAHNTIVVDNKDQAETAEGTPELWETLAGFDYVHGYHDAYSGIRHRRKIFFVKPDYWIISDLVTGSGSHTYDLYFHLEPAYLQHHELHPIDNSISTPNFIILPGDQQASAEIVQGWVSHNTGSEEEAPTVKYSKQGYPPITFETVIYPFAGSPVPVSVSKQVVYNNVGSDLPDDEAVAMKISFTNRSDYFCLNHIGEELLTFNTFYFSGELAFISENSTGSIENIELVRGTLLHKGDTLLVDTYSKSANISWFQQTVYIDGEDIQSAKIWAPQADSLIVNGGNKYFIQNGDYIEFDATSIINTNKSRLGFASGFHLEQNYPNPFNGSTSIRFNLQNEESVSLQIFDLTGKLITTLIDQRMEPGEYTVYWYGMDKNTYLQNSGIYFYRLKVRNAAVTKRMLLLK